MLIRRSAILILCQAVWVASFAQAQNAPAPATDATALQEVTVTAQRKSENLESAPVTVTALDASALQDLQINRSTDLANSVPNLSIFEGAAGRSMVNLYMRGAGVQVGAMVTSESAVGMYVDDVYQARLSGANGQLEDLQQVEVLRGPQGTLYGRNSLTGAIKYVTLTPEVGEPTSGDFTVGGGAFDTWELKGLVQGTLIDDFLAGSFTSSFTSNGGYQPDIAQGGEKRDAEDMGAARGKLNFALSPNDKLILSLSFSHNHDDGRNWVAYNEPALTGIPGVYPLSGGYNTSQSPTDEYGSNEQYGISATYTHNFADFTLKSVSAYLHQLDVWYVDLSGGINEGEGFYLGALNRLSRSASQQGSEELQVQGKTGQFEWIGGLYLFYEQGYQVVNDVLFGSPILPQIIDVHTRSWSTFAQGTYHLTDALDFTVGLRETRDYKDLYGSIADSAFSPNSTQFFESNTYPAFTPKAGIDYTVVPGTLLYTSVSKGFEAGGYNSLVVADPVEFKAPYGPETVVAYEFGEKTELFNRRLRINTSLFYNHFNAIQLGAAVEGTTNYPIQNSGTAADYGVELEVQAVPLENWTVFGNATWQHGEYLTPTPNSEAAIDHAHELPFVSEGQWQIGSNYTVFLPVGGKVRFGGDWNYRGAFYSDASNLPVTLVGDYKVINAFAEYSPNGGNWTLKISGRNLGNEQYDVIGLALVQGIRVPGEPRTWLAELNYKF
jgi:iron complex outermembrane receptor protein